MAHEYADKKKDKAVNQKSIPVLINSNRINNLIKNCNSLKCLPKQNHRMLLNERLLQHAN